MKSKRITSNIQILQINEVFVFGSNELGIHGKGAAKTAKQWGAKHGQSSGLMGQAYGIPTVKKLYPYTVLSLKEIELYVNDFIEFAKLSKDKIFYVTEIGCGLAGYKAKEIAPLFFKAKTIDNIFLPKSFWDIINYL